MRQELPEQTEKDGLFEFFLVVTPGLEQIAAWEFGQWHPGREVRVERGGLTVHLPLDLGLSLNRKLKAPTRILVRLSEFTCREFPKLFRKVSTFPWEKWVSEPIEFKASSHRSRLRIKKRIEDVCADAFRARFKKQGRQLTESKEKEEAVSALVRFEDDVCVLSLDTSGVLLHKRGFKDFSTEAPIRETMAAAVLLMMEKAAGELGLELPVELLDPMSGSGTFLLEGACLEKSLSNRTFAFERFVNAPEELPGPEARREATLFTSLIGFETDSDACAAAKKNFESISRKITLVNQDVFQAEELSTGVRRWVVTNPPYGERLKVKGPLSKYYESLFEAVERVAKPELAAFVLPVKAQPERLKKPRHWRTVSRVRFLNGGIPVMVCLFRRQ